jgi:hypothetical protein
MINNSSIQLSEDKSSNNKLLDSLIDKRLTKRQFKFIELINKGLSVVEAYKLSGYKGLNKQSPYQLNHYLKGSIAKIAEANGFNKNRLMIELNKLIDLPLDNSKLTVTLREKLSIIRTLAKCLPDVLDKPKESFTRFTIVNNIVTNDTKPINVTDVTEIKE